ncbi:hypothetical protein WA026_020036 [Henosepilachna vigintioctopunctata]|uniref:Uncharacterized protein n=1 Tax=Henosepilachna vigintioctopunctata TaxID=420089 RepID=A0AAW1V2X9_9CUCU
MGELITKMDISLEDMTLARQTEVIESVKLNGDKIDEFNEQIEKVRFYMKTVKGLEHELMVVKKGWSSLKSEVQMMKQMSRSNNIQICGVQKRKNENMIDVLKKIGHEVNFAVSEIEIQTIHRVAPFYDQVKGTSKNIIVKFVNSSVRSAFLTAFWRNGGRHCTTKMINPNAEARARYLNEHLSPYSKCFTRKAETVAKY